MLSRWQSTIVDERGNVQPLANLTVRNEADQSLAKMWASPGTSQPLPDGMVQADGNGYAFFYARGGLYRITSAALGIDWRAVQIGAALVSIGDYAAGLEITARNQIFWRDGELYRAGAVLELPYTTTGDWGVEEGLFVAVGDQALRQELLSSTGSGIVGYKLPGTGSVFRTTQERLADFVSVKDFGAIGDGITDDTAAIQAALDWGRSLHFPSGDYKVTSTLTVTTPAQTLTGEGWASVPGGACSRIFSNLDITLFVAGNSHPTFRNLFLDNTAEYLSKPHIHFAGGGFPTVEYCRLSAAANINSKGGGITLDGGNNNYGGSVGLINNTNISHGSIIVHRSDVHIKNCWLWANTRPYAVWIKPSSGNVVLEGCDLLPPLRSVVDRKAAVWIQGAVVAPRLLGCNFDGNDSLETGSGLLAENGVIGLLVSGCYGFGHDESCIILDSIISPQVTNCAFIGNNRRGTGACDIELRQTYAQNMHRPLISNCSFTQTSAIPSGVISPAIKVLNNVHRDNIKIIDNSIFQPGDGGGYTNIEILLEGGRFNNDREGSLSGNSGRMTLYKNSGTSSFLSSDVFKSIPVSSNFAYPPRVDQITINIESSGPPPNIRFSPGNMDVDFIRVGLHGTFDGGTICYRVSL